MKKLPKAPLFSLALIGPGVVLIAMGLGSGEYILWPSLVSQYGFGIMWGAIVGMLSQYILSYEISRYTVATGGSIFTGFAKISKWFSIWFILSSYLSFMWPGIIASGGRIFVELFGMSDYRLPTIIMLLIIGCLLSFGGKVYNNLERFQKLVILITIPVLVYIAVTLFDTESFNAMLVGTLGVGDGFNFLPKGIDVATFLGAIAYSGAAGNLILSQSFYVQDEKLGMAGYLDTQINIKNDDRALHEGFQMDVSDPENMKNFRKWMKNIAIEQGIAFFALGTFTIFLLVYIAYELTFPTGGANSDLSFIFKQAQILSELYTPILGPAFLLVGVIFLFKTQLGVFESTSRIMTDNIQIFSDRIRVKFSKANIFYFFLWSQIFLAIIITLLDVSQPVQILVLGTFFSAIATFGIGVCLLILYNSNQLAEELKPKLWKKIVLGLLVAFYGIFVLATIYDFFS